jgi:hypothetical protein
VRGTVFENWFHIDFVVPRERNGDSQSSQMRKLTQHLQVRRRYAEQGKILDVETGIDEQQ